MRSEEWSYLPLLRFAVSKREEVPDTVRTTDWRLLLDFAKKQAIVGVLAPMMLERDERLEQCRWLGNRPTDDDIMEWMGAVRKLESRNRLTNEKAAWVSRNFTTEGFHNCLLKGQGNALLYPHPEWRTPGDIDIWVWPKQQEPGAEGTEVSDEVNTVITYCRSIVGNKKACYHHIEFRSAGKIPIEVHYRPSWLNNPFHNRRLQRWFLSHRAECGNNGSELGANIPTWEFNVVFQLCHIYNHLLHEGIGLRQFFDYYYLLTGGKGGAEGEYTREAGLHRLGLLPIAGATMWILKEVMGMEETYMVCHPDERRGRVLLREIMASGNFGHHDRRLLSGSYQSPVKSNVQRLVRDFRLMRHFPSECLWEPWFRLYHCWWRWRHRGVGIKS